MDTSDPIISHVQEQKVQQIKVLNLKKNDIDLLTLSSDMLDIYFDDDTDGIKQLILEYQFLNNNRISKFSFTFNNFEIITVSVDSS